MLNDLIKEALIKTASSEGIFIHKKAGLFDSVNEKIEQQKYEKADRRAQKLHEREMKLINRDLQKTRAQSNVDLHKGISINSLIDPNEIRRTELGVDAGKLALENRKLDESAKLFKGIGESIHGAAKHLSPYLPAAGLVLGTGLVLDPIAHLIHGDPGKK